MGAGGICMADQVEIVERAICSIRQQYPAVNEQKLRQILMRADIADVERLRGAMSRMSLEELADLLK